MLSEAERGVFNAKAMALRAERRETLQGEAEHVSTRLELQEASLQAQENSTAMVLRNCRLSVADTDALQRLHDAELLKGQMLKTYHSRAVHCPEPLTDEDFNALVNAGYSSLCIPPCMSQVSTQLCSFRSELSRSIVGIFDDDGNATWFQYVYALQRPHVCFWLQLSTQDNLTMEKPNMTAGDWRNSEFHSYTAVFSYVDGDYTSEDVLLNAPEHAISIYTDTHVLGPSLLAARGKLRLFGPWLDDLFSALPQRKQRDTSEKPCVGAKPSISKKVQAASLHDPHASHHTPASSSIAPALPAPLSPASADASSDVSDLVADVTAEAQATSDKVWEEIEAARETYTTVDDSMETCFRQKRRQTARRRRQNVAWTADALQSILNHH
eukprot:3824000-Amphidinium_carterae.2